MGDHPVKVPAELVEKIARIAADLFPEDEGDFSDVYAARDEHLANYFAQWGADQELEAVEHWLITGPYGASIVTSAPTLIADLRIARRPNPPTLAEQALEQYKRVEDILFHQDVIPAGCIRAALNRLAELEADQ